MQHGDCGVAKCNGTWEASSLSRRCRLPENWTGSVQAGGAARMHDQTNVTCNESSVESTASSGTSTTSSSVVVYRSTDRVQQHSTRLELISDAEVGFLRSLALAGALRPRRRRWWHAHSIEVLGQVSW